MSVASSGETDGDSEYFESPENLPTISANTLQLKSHILELKQIQEVAEDNIDYITQLTDLFTHPVELNPTELAKDGTTPDENHEYNRALTRHVTQPSFPNLPLKDASVDTDDPPPRPCVEDSDATHLSRMRDLPKVRPKGAYYEL